MTSAPCVLLFILSTVHAMPLTTTNVTNGLDCSSAPLPDGCPCGHKYDCKSYLCVGTPPTCGGVPSPPAPPTPPQPKVVTPSGEVLGVFYDKVDAFFGIPYAEPPVRFSPPVPKASWAKPLNATLPGDICLQAPETGALPDPNATVDYVGSENCLFLNVFTPRAAGRFPVLFFIHGGGFIQGSGSSPTYNGTQLAASQNVTVVTINYRLGPLGFFANKELLSETGTSGGMNGIYDQIEALRWVQNNIYSLGGNPNAVTIFGESAGAESVAILAASPLAKGLFHRAIVDSGVVYGPWGFATLAQGTAVGEKWMKAVNASSIADLRKLNSSEVLRSYNAVQLRCQPSIDNKVMPNNPKDNWMNGTLNVDALIMGMDTADALAEWPYQIYGSLSKDTTPAEAAKILSIVFHDVPLANVTEQYPASRFGNRSDIMVYVANRDRAVLCPMNRMSQWATAHKIPTFQYLFGSSWEGGALNVTTGNTTTEVDLPASFMPHGLELNQVFGLGGLQKELSSMPWDSFVASIYSEELTTSVQNYFGSFTTVGIPADKHSHAVWPLVNSDFDMPNYMYFSEPQPEYDGTPGPMLLPPTQDDWAFWDQWPID